MNALVIGAGAIGRVVAYHLHQGGGRVSILAREHRLQEMDQGYTLYPLNRRGARSRPVHFSSVEPILLGDELLRQPWDAVFFCVPSDALGDALMGPIAEVAGGATIVKIQPGLRDRQMYVNWFPEDQLITGMLSIISYRAPLADEQVPEPGTAYWFPPLLPCLFSGPADRLWPITDTLQAGGFPVREDGNVDERLGLVLAMEAPLTAGLECAGWSIHRFRQGPWVEVSARAIQEAVEIASTQLEVTKPKMIRFIGRRTIRWAAVVLPLLVPLPLEAYLQYHFTKLSGQSRQHISDYIEAGTQWGLPVGALRKLMNDLEASTEAIR